MLLGHKCQSRVAARCADHTANLCNQSRVVSPSYRGGESRPLRPDAAAGRVNGGIGTDQFHVETVGPWNLPSESRVAVSDVEQ